MARRPRLAAQAAQASMRTLHLVTFPERIR